MFDAQSTHLTRPLNLFLLNSIPILQFTIYNLQFTNLQGSMLTS